MKLHQLKINFTRALKDVHDQEEIASFFYILCDFFLKYSRFQTSINKDVTISEAHVVSFEMVTRRLKAQEPIQYILGETEFYGLPIKLTKHTLIPRPETEELVDWVLSNEHFQKAACRILDIGTGSGCIAIALAKSLPVATVFAIDISEEALEVATANALQNEVLVAFHKKDILEVVNLKETYDVVISNPPYVRELEKTAMSSNVLDYEPATALFVTNKDPLVFYRKIAKLAMQSLSPGGWLYFEINEYLAQEMAILLEQLGFVNIEMKKDFREVPRMIKCKKI
ncbi:MAG: release factor glutamine methyltransferase [Patiriisocius sp.]